MVDTGSQLLGVAAAGCDTCTAAGVSHLYTPGPTAVDQHRQGSNSFGDGSSGWKGEIYTDAIAADTFPPITLAFTAITSQTNFFYAGSCGDPEGILGLDAVLDPRGAPTNLLHELAAAGATDEFAIHYCLGHGDLWFDGFDPAATRSEPMWAPMDQGGGNYTVVLEDLAVDGTSLGLSAASFGQALVDSGGPNLLVPPAAFAALTTKIAASPAFRTKFGDATWFRTTGNCKAIAETRAELDAELPRLTVLIGSPAISIDLPATAAYLQSYMTPNGMTYCQALYSFPQFTDLGNTLYRAGIVIHDREHGRLGFASAPPCSDTAAQVVSHPPDLSRLIPGA
jgi:hypothetical protein